MSAHALSITAKQKYPYPLLTDDYGILSANDLAAYTWGLKPRPFTAEAVSGEYTYWQCFPRELVVITLEDTGSSSDEVGWRDNVGDLQIKVVVNPHLIHEYDMRARWTVLEFEKRFTLWRTLMNKEKYVCLAGGFVHRERTIENGKVRELYEWTFEKIKTQKGCDSYFDSCHPSYKIYLRERAQQEQLKNA